MYWWQWILQITGAWFYLGLVVLWLWSSISSRDNGQHTPGDGGELIPVTFRKV